MLNASLLVVVEVEDALSVCMEAGAMLLLLSSFVEARANGVVGRGSEASLIFGNDIKNVLSDPIFSSNFHGQATHTKEMGCQA